MREYTITTADALTAHRIAGELYAKLCPIQDPLALPKGRPPMTDQVPGEYFKNDLRAGYRATALGGSFEVQVDSEKSKSGRDYTHRFRIVLDENARINQKDFERAVREVQETLGSRRVGRA